jgi:hypothetical protein
MKKIVLSLALSLTAVTADAATIVVQSGNPAQEFKINATTPLSLVTGGIAIGFFRNYTAAMNPMLADETTGVLDFVAQNFIPIGRFTSDVDYGTNSVANPLSLRPTVAPAPPGTTAAGTIENSNWLAAGGAVTANSVQDGGLVRGTRIFVLAYDGVSLESASFLGIYSASTWTISTSAAVNTLSLTLTQADIAAEVYRGSIGSLILAPVGVIPEPSTSLMALLAGVGMMARRRR